MILYKHLDTYINTLVFIMYIYIFPFSSLKRKLRLVIGDKPFRNFIAIFQPFSLVFINLCAIFSFRFVCNIYQCPLYVYIYYQNLFICKNMFFNKVFEKNRVFTEQTIFNKLMKNDRFFTEQTILLNEQIY